ncbi:MAG: hypothetical protein CM1200mP40_12220 [Gammaproteobacteria bacterium]|nr:MAG: hypothetical protein CM1200mP40_12220 [Gammaproteobacteria bacterium]
MFDSLIDWCFENPRLFWTIIIIGGIGDLFFFSLLVFFLVGCSDGAEF